MDIQHYPVMYREALRYLALKDKKIIVDCTVGLGSHTLHFFEHMDDDATLIGIDKDEESLQMARTRLKQHTSRYRFFKDDFRNLDVVLESAGVLKADAFFFDLGISRYQLARPERGFSFLEEGPLDMRMDKDSFVSAYDLVNYLSEGELQTIFQKFGEERFSRRIAHCVVEERRYTPITTTTQLSNLVTRVVPRSVYRQRIHPATRIFQALRIAVNRELDSLEIGLNKAAARLGAGGRIVVISFHSLEDRIVKNTFKKLALEGVVKILTKKPLVPSGEEISQNSASRSAKLRVAEGSTCLREEHEA